MSSSRGRVLSRSLLLLILLGPACATRTAGPAPAATPSLSASDQLRQSLDTLFTSAPGDRAMWGVMVRTAGGPLLYERNPHLLLHPASNMKLVTLAAAATTLGWDFRFDTTVRSTTPVLDDGSIRGDLVITGSGDPTISRRNDGRATLLALADQLWQRGVRRIDGRVIGDGSAFGPTSYGSGWQWDDLPFGYAAPVSALIYNENTAEYAVGPGPSVGARAQVRLVDTSADTSVVNAITTTDSATPRRIGIERAASDIHPTLRGEIPLGAAPSKLFVTVADPPAYFARAVKEALIARGIVVNGPARSMTTDSPGPIRDDARVLTIRHQSPPLRELAKTLMKVSQNLYAEVLFRTIGQAAGAGKSAASATASAIASWGTDAADVVIADGSGLSRYNLTTAAALDAVLSRMFGSAADREPWLATLPIGGVDGTLERRLKGTESEGRVFAKTGSIAYVRALSGYVQTTRGEWLQFVILANNFAGKVSAADIDRVTDQAVTLLARR